MFQLVCVGKTHSSALQSLIAEYEKRLRFYTKFEWVIIPESKVEKSLPETIQKEKEGKRLLEKLKEVDMVILLDEKGTEYTSPEFSEFLQKKMNASVKRCAFVIGGPYGFSEEVYARAQHCLAFSKMTFSHQMIRLFLIEQLYRAFTILRNEPYHHG